MTNITGWNFYLNILSKYYFKQDNYTNLVNWKHMWIRNQWWDQIDEAVNKNIPDKVFLKIHRLRLKLIQPENLV